MFKDGKIFTAPTLDRISPGPLGVRTYDRDRAFRGYTLFSNGFGNVEYLIDMNGMVVHTWPVFRSQLAEILPNGHLLADGYNVNGHISGRLYELLPDGSVYWSWEHNYHHDFYLLPNDNIVTLIYKNEPVVEGYYVPAHAPDHMRTDVVVEINRNGDILWSFSFSEHLEDLCAASGLELPVSYAREQSDGTVVVRGNADWAHTNTIEVLPDTPLGHKDSRFRAGNLLFSFRSLDIIGIIDREKEEIVWAWGLGELDGQHHPNMLANGNILIFDNGTYRNYSRGVEIDPVAEKIVWEYADGENFYSPYRSGIQRLPNGNTMICECDAGRIFEVTQDKEIVWDYYSPFMGQGQNNQGRHIHRATRYADEQVEPVLAARKDEKIVAVGDAQRQPMRTFPEALKYYRENFGG